MKKLFLLSALLIFACSSDDSTSDDYNDELLNCDGNPVPTIVYGTQEWSVENACNITYRDGTSIPEVTDNTEWQNLTTGAWCYHNNDPTKPRLYNWYAVAGIHDNDESTPNKEFAPEGWHVPSDIEWTTLEEHLIANGYNYYQTTTENSLAKAMASTTGWLSSTILGNVGNNQSTNNSSGFNAFPEGGRESNGVFSGDMGNSGAVGITFFWSFNELITNGAWFRGLNGYSTTLYRFIGINERGYSVRFVRD